MTMIDWWRHVLNDQWCAPLARTRGIAFVTPWLGLRAWLRRGTAAAALAALLAASPALAHTHRGTVAPHQFMRAHPCPGGPNKGNTNYPCEGYIIDHIKPLCLNGEDKPRNMQWQTKEEAHAKDLWECHGMRLLPLTHKGK